MNSGVKPQKKGLYHKISEKTVLAHKFWGDNKYLGTLRPRIALQRHEPIIFFGAQSSLWGHNSRLGGSSSDLGGTAPECRRGLGPAAN